MVFLNRHHNNPRYGVVLGIMLWSVAFFLHFFWEMMQVPFFLGMVEASHGEVVWLCARATVGDANIALGAYGMAALAGGGWYWATDLSRRRSLIVYVTSGLLVTVVFELWATGGGARWKYSDLMPELPLIGLGLLPLIQWLTLPMLTIIFVKWMYLGWSLITADERL